MTRLVFDSSAVLAYFFSEAGGEQVAPVLQQGLVSTVNLTEIATRLIDTGLPVTECRERLATVPFRIVPFSGDHALEAGALRPATRAAGLSLGDRACLALARLERLPVLTADRAWPPLAASLDLDIRLVRPA